MFVSYGEQIVKDRHQKKGFRLTPRYYQMLRKWSKILCMQHAIVVLLRGAAKSGTGHDVFVVHFLSRIRSSDERPDEAH